MSEEYEAAYEQALNALERDALRRDLKPVTGQGNHTSVRGEDGSLFVSFSSNDYLGLANHPKVVEAAHRGIDECGVGSGASRLITGTHPAHLELERVLAAFKGVPAALTFANGYAAASGFATAFLSKRSIVLLDKLSHACLIDACRLSQARLRVFRHNDLDKLDYLLKWSAVQPDVDRVVIMTESIFSMDGDAAPLQGIVDLKNRYGAQLLLDEAHAVGVIGPQGAGLAAELGLTVEVDFHLGTLGKALGVAGGYLAGSRAMIDLLVNKARSFIYSTAPPPSLAPAVMAAIDISASEEGDRRRDQLRSLVNRLTSALGLVSPPAAIVPIAIGEASKALARAVALRERGFYVPAIRYPTVARGEARLRLTVTADHTEAQIDALTHAMVD